MDQAILARLEIELVVRNSTKHIVIVLINYLDLDITQQRRRDYEITAICREGNSSKCLRRS
jgi:hypothetical protein